MEDIINVLLKSVINDISRRIRSHQYSIVFLREYDGDIMPVYIDDLTGGTDHNHRCNIGRFAGVDFDYYIILHGRYITDKLSELDMWDIGCTKIMSIDKLWFLSNGVVKIKKTEPIPTITK